MMQESLPWLSLQRSTYLSPPKSCFASRLTNFSVLVGISGDQLGPHANIYLKIYYGLHLVPGHVLLPLLLLLFIFSKGAKRHPTLINVLISYIVSSIVACLL
jgi:hypothetical protein